MNSRWRFGPALLLAGWTLSFGATPPKPTLDIAKDEVTSHADWKYGTNAATKHIDCVQFVLRVVEARLGAPLSAAQRKATLLAYNWTAAEIQAIPEAGTDPRLGGVVHALTTLGSQGTAIQPANAKPGDLIQYWMKRSDGTWFGHSGVISKVTNGKVKILGAHQSPAPDGKIGESDFELNLTGANRRIYLVRL